MGAKFKTSTTGLFIIFFITLYNVQAFAFSPTPANPTEVLFYPGEARLTVEEKLKPEQLPYAGYGFLITLPEVARRDSFELNINGDAFGNYYFLDDDASEALVNNALAVPESNKSLSAAGENLPERKKLLDKIEVLEAEVSRLEGEEETAKARINFWNNAVAFYKRRANAENNEAAVSFDELSRFDAAYAAALPGLYTEKAKNTRSLKLLETELEKANEELTKFDSKKNYTILAVSYNEDNKREQSLKYQYAVGASSSRNYVLNADTDKKEVSITQNISLYQNTGFAFENVDVYISSLSKDTVLRPQNVQPWTVSHLPLPGQAEGREKFEFARGYANSQMAINAMAPPKASEPIAQKPVQEEKGNYRIWHLGKKRIDNKANVSFTLAKDTYEARFYYTLRPADYSKAFLSVELSLQAALELPPGTARFYTDGQSVGSQSFSFNGDKGILFFGTDPLVTATVRDLDRGRGEKGLISKEKTLLRHWQFTIKNSRSKLVEVVVEEPAPLAEEDDINITMFSKPKPETSVNMPLHGGAKILTWKNNIEPGASFIIDHKVEISGPTDKDLNIGRMR